MLQTCQEYPGKTPQSTFKLPTLKCKLCQDIRTLYGKLPIDVLHSCLGLLKLLLKNQRSCHIYYMYSNKSTGSTKITPQIETKGDISPKRLITLKIVGVLVPLDKTLLLFGSFGIAEIFKKIKLSIYIQVALLKTF